MSSKTVKEITSLVSVRFPSLPLTRTELEALVRFILVKQGYLKRLGLNRIGNDARDINFTADFLRPLSSNALRDISTHKRIDIRQRLERQIYPFSRLDKETRERLAHLPNSWILEAAAVLLNERKLRSKEPIAMILTD